MIIRLLETLFDKTKAINANNNNYDNNNNREGYSWATTS